MGNPSLSSRRSLAVCGKVVLTLAVLAVAHPAAGEGASVLGTWSGRSTCVGDRPACKNEVVVYRFVYG